MAAKKNTKAKKSPIVSPAVAPTAAEEAKAPPSKAEFIRSLPKDLPASEVVAKAKEIGIELSNNHVHAARSSSKDRSKKASKKAAKKPVKQVAKKPSEKGATKAKGGAKKSAAKVRPSAPKPLSKTAFVLSLPRELPATEVIARAKAAGLDIARERVHVIRSTAKSSKAPAKKAAGPKASSKPQHPKSAAPATPMVPKVKVEDSTVAALRDLVFSLGFERLRGLVADMQKKASA